jgi:hypothetical protein
VCALKKIKKFLLKTKANKRENNLSFAKKIIFINLRSSPPFFSASSSLSANSANFTKLPATIESNNNVHSTINNNHNNFNQQQSVSHQQIFSNFITGQHQSPPSLRNPSIMPKNEPVKLVYPTNNNNNTQSSTIVTMNNNNNRVTFSSAPVQNGTITLSQMQANQLAQQQGQQQQVMQGGNIKITGQGGQQAPTLIFKNAISSAPGTFVTSSPMTMSKANNNQVRILRIERRMLSEKRKINSNSDGNDRDICFHFLAYTALQLAPNRKNT